MSSTFKYLTFALLSLALGVFQVTTVNAHMMTAQHGTLNVADDGAYMILSLPVSVFNDIDDDGDARLSMKELNLHRHEIIEAVTTNVTLSDDSGSLTLQGVMLSPVEAHAEPNGPVSQLIVLGRFALRRVSSPMHFQVGLFGETPAEQLLHITATRKFDGKKHVFELTPANSTGILFPHERYGMD